MFFLSPCGSATLQVFTLTLHSISQNSSALQPPRFSPRYLLSQCKLIESVDCAGFCKHFRNHYLKKAFCRECYFNAPLYALENKESAESMHIIKWHQTLTCSSSSLMSFKSWVRCHFCVYMTSQWSDGSFHQIIVIMSLTKCIIMVTVNGLERSITLWVYGS